MIIIGVCAICGACLAEAARDIIAQCTFSGLKTKYRSSLLYDGSYKYAWETGRTKYVYLEVRLPEGETCNSVQIK